MELMEGLTLLSTDTTACKVPGLLIVLGILCFILSIYFIVMSIMFFINREPIGVLVILLAIAMVMPGAIAIDKATKPAKTIYKVIVDEQVSMVNFNEQYEILEQDGLIYEIVERDVP